MMGLVHCAPKPERDALDAEFDAVYKEAQVKQGIRYGGLFLVTPETGALLKVADAKAPVPSLFQRMGDTVYDAVEHVMGRRPSNA
jgi:hypothetical protein